MTPMRMDTRMLRLKTDMHTPLTILLSDMDIPRAVLSQMACEYRTSLPSAWRTYDLKQQRLGLLIMVKLIKQKRRERCQDWWYYYVWVDVAQCVVGAKWEVNQKPAEQCCPPSELERHKTTKDHYRNLIYSFFSFVLSFFFYAIRLRKV